MSAREFRLPRGAILFTRDGFQYEFREDLGEVHHGLSLLLARRRTPEGSIRGKVLLKALGVPQLREMPRIKRARAKLEEQVRLATYLDHPGILRVHGLHKAEGCWYVITEHPSGNSISNLLTLVGECRRRFSALFTLHVGARVAEALEHAHEARDEQGRPLHIVHRALDVENLFVDWNGGVQVSDFGLALSDLPGRVSSTVRRPQGDAFYSSPEMLLTGRVDARSDLFALGNVLLELATGRNLLDASDDLTDEVKGTLSVRQRRRVRHAIKRAQLAGSPPMVADAIWRAATYTQADLEALTKPLPQGLRVTLLRLLQPRPDDRYQTARELAADLRRWLGEGAAYGKKEAVAELYEMAKRAHEELMVELGMRRPRGPQVPQDEFSTS
ncbi:serine/threonine protein kinase [Corallococcus coralloides DSM 2259]|uniref:non-specific serine/threonine protein kinase n=1 Tax=Corallococcus coralloides (strain ATCC 25202 / DSM 2259 / NBRC 100086 / M2) TaxID=1144275 RepID=H8MGZ5_CORCM|nr:protein kinase [Corallococcus coralloides]AFE09338.1 serine/threonine protein kinase [Corallococcus coralloides DSM 2259]